MSVRIIQLFIILTIIGLSTDVGYSADEDYKYALSLMKERKEYKNAAEKFDNFVSANPQSKDAPKALFYMASCLAQLGKDSSAANTFEGITRLYPQADRDLLINSYAYSADAYFRAKLYQKASQLYTHLITNYPDITRAESSLYWLAECYNRLATATEKHTTDNTFYRQALANYRRLAEKYPTSRFLPDALTGAGLLAYNFKDYQQSSYFFSRYNEIDIKLEPARQELITYHEAESLYWLKDYKAAEKRFNSVIEDYPEGRFIAECYAGLGWCRYSLGDPAQAAQSFQRAAEKYKTENEATNAHFDAAAAFEEAGNTTAAIQEYKQVIKTEAHPRKQTAMVRLGVLQKDNSSPEITELLHQAFTPEQPNANKDLSVEAGILLAEKKFDQKEYSAAEKIFLQIIEIAPNSKHAPYALYQLALVRSHQQKYTQASKAIKLLLKNYPDSPLKLQAAYAIADYQDILGDSGKCRIAYRWLAEESEKWAENFLSKHTVDDPEKFTREAKDIAAASLLRLAESLFKDRNNPESVAQAKDYFGRYITRYPDNPRLPAALLRMGELTESDDLEIAHTYFKNAIRSADSSTDNTDPELENIIMHAKYRLCLNNILLAKKTATQTDKQKKYLTQTLEKIDSFFRDYQNTPAAENLLVQLRYYRSETEYSLGDTDAALQGYEQSYHTAGDSNIADAALFSSAWIEQKRGNTASASSKLKTLLDEYPDSQYCSNALYILALNSRRESKLKEAQRYLQLLLEKYPNPDFSGKALIELARIHTLQDDFTSAATCLQKVLTDTASPDYPDALYTLSWVDSNKVDTVSKENKAALWRKITFTLEELLNKFPEYKQNTLARFRLGEVAYSQQDYPKAASWYQKIITEKNPELQDKAHYRLAWCYLKQANLNSEFYSKALDEFLLICREYPKSGLFAESALRAGKLLRQAERYTEALKLYRKAEKNSDKPDIIMAAEYGQGVALLQLEEYSQALRIFKKYLKAYPQSPLLHEANWGAGQAALMLGASADATDYFNQAKADNYLGEAAAKARYGLGIIAMEKNEFKLAREEFRKVDVFHSQWQDIAAEALLKAAEASRELGEMKPAESDLKRIIDIYTNTASAHKAEELLLSEAEK